MKSITFVISTMSGGGAERVISVLSNQFAKSSYNVTIVTTSGDVLEYNLDDRIKYRPIVIKNKSRVLTVIYRAFLTSQYIKNSKPDVVVSFLPTASMYAVFSKFFNRSKLVISERMDPYQDPKSFVLRKVRDFLYGFADSFVFQTIDAKEYFNKRIQQRGEIISNPLKENLPERFNGKRKKEIVTAVRLAPQKNLYMLLDAFKLFHNEYPEYSLKIYGEGELRGQLEGYINKLDLKDNAFIMGFSKDLHNEIIDASMFVLPSDYEGISNSMIEALAIGLPLISTDHPIGGARMFIEHGKNGLLVSVGDSFETYKAMELLSTNNELADRISRNAVNIREELNVKSIAERWFRHLNNVINMGNQ